LGNPVKVDIWIVSSCASATLRCLSVILPTCACGDDSFDLRALGRLVLIVRIGGDRCSFTHSCLVCVGSPVSSRLHISHTIGIPITTMSNVWLFRLCAVLNCIRTTQLRVQWLHVQRLGGGWAAAVSHGQRLCGAMVAVANGLPSL
jgi:hypothetical protein